MKCKIAPILMFLVPLYTGYLGWALRPDTYTYEHGNLTHAPLTGLIGLLAGRNGIIIASALASGISTYLVPPGKSRAIFLLFAAYWFLHPGADAIGVMFILLYDRTNRRSLWVVALLAHPVAALTTIPRLFSSWQPWLVTSMFLAALSIYVVGSIDTYDTTSRYLLPVIALLTVRIATFTKNRVVTPGIAGQPTRRS
jgi:hypothetical protein